MVGGHGSRDSHFAYTRFTIPLTQSRLVLLLPVRPLSSLPELPLRSLTAFPLPPRPTWYTGAASPLSLSRSSSSSKRNMGRSSLLGWRLPAPPRPVVNLECAEPAE